MKSRMEKYYNDEEVMQRTTKNDSLYDELYKEKQKLNSNVTILDDTKEIDISKIKEMIDKRENYKKVRDYNNLMTIKEKNDTIDYNFDEIDNNDYDINKIIDKKRNNKISDERVRNISKEEYEELKALAVDNKSDYGVNHEARLKDLLNTITNAEGDLFSNLKEDEPKEEKESTFYTSTSEIATDDFEGFEDKKKPNIFVIIAVLSILIAIGIVIYINYFN